MAYLWVHFLSGKKKFLKQDIFIRKFGSMYLDINIDRMLAILYTAIFSLRRVLLVLFLLWLQPRKMVTLIYIYLALYSLNFWYLTHAWPHIESGLNFLECFNELCLIGLHYTMIFFVYGTKVSA